LSLIAASLLVVIRMFQCRHLEQGQDCRGDREWCMVA